MSTTDSFSWGAETISREDPGTGRAAGVTRQRSLLGLRMAALIIDGVLLVMPLIAVAFALSLAFPHRGFFFSRSAISVSSTGSRTADYHLGLPGLLVISALSLSYFFLMETLCGQTVGKRTMGLHVRSASGRPAGPRAIAVRTLARLIDGLPIFYLVGALVALLSGSRRRRIGDWAAGTIVVSDHDPIDSLRRRASWSAALYPAGLIAAVLLAIFTFGLGANVSEGERAIALVQSYIKAREQGHAALACSLLTGEQQREIVAIESNDYPHASASLCPAYILRSEPDSHLLNPKLDELSVASLISEPTPLGAVVVRSRYPVLDLIVVPEDGRLKLDMRGVERLAFIRVCTSTNMASTSSCACTFRLMRIQAMVPEGGLTPSIVRAIGEDELRCRGTPAGAQLAFSRARRPVCRPRRSIPDASEQRRQRHRQRRTGAIHRGRRNRRRL
jgi:uncharacterized RDD family membrane protein YckC